MAIKRKTEPFPTFNVILNINKVKPIIWIGGEVPSLKNSKRIVQVKTKMSVCCKAPIVRLGVGNFICAHCKKATKHLTQPRLVPSEAVDKYVERTKKVYASANLKSKFTLWQLHNYKPLYLGFYFVRETERTWDFNNITQLVQDLLVTNGLISEDDTKSLIPVYLGHHKDADNPGVIIMPLLDYEIAVISYLVDIHKQIVNKLNND